MGSKIFAAVVIVIILLVGIFLLVPEAFQGIVPDKYMPDEEPVVTDTEIHWQTRVSETTVTVAPDVNEPTEIIELESDTLGDLNNGTDSDTTYGRSSQTS